MQQAWRAGLIPTAAQREEHAERQAAIEASSGVPRNLKIAGDVAEIRVEGVLTQKPDFFAYWYGGGNTTYEQIQQAFALAQADTGVKRVSLYVDSPGGEVSGLFDALAAIEAFSKPISVLASCACSAAYAIASVAGKIEGTNAAAQFGSIGVAATFWVFEEQVTITSTEAPDKRPDLSTEEGRAVVRKFLDDIHEVFAAAIAKGRETTVEKVNTEFGRGATLLAGEAKKRGLIDKIAKPALRAVNVTETAIASEKGPQTEPTQMNLETLKKDHPELFAAVVKEGVAQERDRVCAHLTMGEQSGDMKTAVAAIQSGDGMTQTLTAKYLAAGMNRADRSARQVETDTAGAAVDGAAAPPAAAPAAAAAAGPAKDLGDQVVEVLDRQHGKKKSA